MVNNSSLHYTIIKHILDQGYAPDLSELSQQLEADPQEVEKGLYKLQEYHGVVLHPNHPKIWVIHPFALAPTNFIVKSENKIWWGNCAWCSLGIAALLKTDATITTRIGAYDAQVTVHINDGKIQEENLLVHFPIPVRKAWDNVIYTCSTMLLFENEHQIDEWTQRHRIPRGDIRPIRQIWEFSKTWYGNHLNPAWQKWTKAEARQIFSEFHLSGDIWDLESSESRF